MSTKQIIDIMNQINQPNTFQLAAYDLTNNDLYWIFKVENVRLKELNNKFVPLRSVASRFDIFINDKIIPNTSYEYHEIGKDFYIYFKMA